MGSVERLVHHALEVPRVVLEAAHQLVGHLRWRDHVAAAEFSRIHAELARRLVDETLEGIRGHRPTRAAVGRCGNGVGENETASHVDRLHVVDAAVHVDQAERVDHRACEDNVGAHVGEVVEAHAEDAAILIQRQFAFVMNIASLLVAEEHLRTRPDPFHRAPELLRRVKERAVFWIRVEAHAETAADFLGDDPHFLGRHAEDRRELPAHGAHALRGGVQEVQVPGRIVGPHGRARLHRIADHARVVRGELHDLRRARERGVGRGLVAADEIEHQIAGRARMELRSARGHGLRGRGHRGQFLVLDDQGFGGVLRLRRGFRHDQGDRLAHVADHFMGEGQALREALIGAVLPLEGRRGGDRLQASLHQLAAGDDRDHAAAFQSSFFFNGSNFRVRAIGADEVPIRLPREIPVGDIASPTGEHAVIFQSALQHARILNARG